MVERKKKDTKPTESAARKSPPVKRVKTTKPAKVAPQKAKLTKAQIAAAVKKTKNKAEWYVGNPDEARKLLGDAVKKVGDFAECPGPLGEVWGYLTALVRLFTAYVHGTYRDIPWGSIVLVACAILYFVSPIDLVPDTIPVLGLMDDAAVIAFVVAQIKADLDYFLAWEITQGGDEGNQATVVG